MKKTKQNKMQDGNFKKKNIKHGHKESARSVFKMPDSLDPLEED
ncbi:CPC_1213 family protein [Haloimpatiens sp. FM7330]